MIRIEELSGAKLAPDAARILRSVGEAAYEWAIAADTLSWTENACEMLGVTAAQIASGRGFAQMVEAAGGQSRFDAVTQAGAKDDGKGVPYIAHYLFRAGKEREPIWVEDTGRWFAGAGGKPARAHGVVRIITQRQERESALLRLANTDPLTGELNRARLVEALSGALDEAVRFRSSCGFMLVAIDNLGRLNQAYGFAVADEIIAQIAKRIRSRLRGKDSLGLFSGNKFGVVLTKCTPDELSIAAERLLAAVRDETITTAAGQVAATVTIGGVTAPRHARNVEEVLSRAQDALEEARSKRHGSFAAYKPNVELDAIRKENVRATDEIISALNDRRITLAFEPVVNAASRHVEFYECLMRVTRPNGMLAHANEIVPVAERVGLVRMLDRRVLELVVEELAAAPSIKASVNVSPSSTTDPNWWAGLGAMLRVHPGVAERLIVEITETIAIQNVEDTRGFVARVKDLGCKIAIDDFGAGYTSFRNLRKLGVDLVKIDGAFVQNMLKNEDDSAFVRALLDLSRTLGLQTVAEWVQDEDTACVLQGWGCDFLQGAMVGLATPQRPWQPEAEPLAVQSA